MTITANELAIEVRKLGLNLKRTHHGEWRLARNLNAYEGSMSQKRQQQELDAYYTDDSQDVLDTAHKLAGSRVYEQAWALKHGRGLVFDALDSN